MRQSSLKTFWQNTYNGKSPVPVIISIQVLLFVLIHIFDLLKEVGLLKLPLYDYSLQYLSLPLSFSQFLQQPWSLLTYPFLYTGLFQLLFDCLWLYWIGNTFLVFLNKRQLLFVYISALVLGAVSFMALGSIPLLQHSLQQSFYSGAFAIVALVSATAALVPGMQLRLLIIGNVRLRYVALVFIALSIGYYALINRAGAISLALVAGWGMLFIQQLQQGRDLSLRFSWKRKSTKLKIVHQRGSKQRSRPSQVLHETPNQAQIDEILDKISLGGYESLTSQEKELLFKASKSES